MPMGVYARKAPTLNCTCLTCGTAFYVKPYKIANGRGKHCSRACADLAKATGPGTRPAHWGRSGPVVRLAEERFFEKVLCDIATGCWNWTGRLTESGYARFCDFSCHWAQGHRFSWEIHNGPIPEDLCVLHKCDALWSPGDISYRRCVRPDHLFLGTKKDNTRDMMVKGRARFRGHRQSLTTPG